MHTQQSRSIDTVVNVKALLIFQAVHPTCSRDIIVFKDIWMYSRSVA